MPKRNSKNNKNTNSLPAKTSNTESLNNINANLGIKDIEKKDFREENFHKHKLTINKTETETETATEQTHEAKSNHKEICHLCKEINEFLKFQKETEENEDLQKFTELLKNIFDKILLAIFQDSFSDHLKMSDLTLISDFKNNIDTIYKNYGDAYSAMIIEILLERISFILMVVYRKTFTVSKHIEKESLEKIKELSDIDKNNKLMKTSVTKHNCKLFKCNCQINQLYYENNMRKLEIISKFEKSLDHLFLFYNNIVNNSNSIAYIFLKFFDKLKQKKITFKVEKILRIELNININNDIILKPLIGKINSIKNEYSALENYKISGIIKEILFYNSPGELITINDQIKKLYTKNPSYIKYVNYDLIPTQNEPKEERTLEEIFDFINNEESQKKKNNKKKKKSNTCEFINCLNNPNYDETRNDATVERENADCHSTKESITICDCDHIDIIVENFKLSLKEHTKHSKMCNKNKPCFTHEWLRSFVFNN